MEQQIYSYCYLFITLALSGALFLLLGGRMIWAKGGHDQNDSAVRHKLPPGSTGLPFIGETIAFLRAANSSRRRKFVDEHELRFGPIFRSNLFGRAKTIVSVDLEFNKYILQNEGKLFQSKILAPTRNLIGKYGLLEVHGGLQKRIHAAAVNLFKYERLNFDFMDAIQNVFLTAMSKWEHQRDIALQHKCNEIDLNLMGKILLGLPPLEERKDIYKAFQDFTKALISLPLNIPGTTYSKGIQARRILIKKIHETIKERREHPEVIHNDLLAKLLRANTFSDEMIADKLLFLLFAGFETVASAMTFAIKFITENPRALKELRAEHDDILKSKTKGNEKMTWDDYQSMKFTHCVIDETIRLASASTIIIRETIQDVEVKVINLQSFTHLDEKYHHDADKFHPWRWQNEQLSNTSAYMPFGAGSRLCPGLHLGRLELAIFLHYFLTKFRWEAVEVDHATYFPLPCMAKGFPIRLYPRLNSE